MKNKILKIIIAVAVLILVASDFCMGQGDIIDGIKIYDINNNLLGLITEDKYVEVSIDDIPVVMQNAIVTVEDKRFYYHSGVDIEGLGRALIRNIMSLKIVEGGSTITQQLVKNVTGKRDKTISRKIEEGVQAMEMEKVCSKQDILERYLNKIYFGNGAYGIDAAARTYFGKSVRNLNLAECATLAGIPRSPSRYNPFMNLDESTARRNLVLDLMVEQNYIPKALAEKTKEMPIELRQIYKSRAPYFVEYVRQKLVELAGKDIFNKKDVSVYTTLDLEMQLAADKIFKMELGELDVDFNLQGAFVAVDPGTGGVRIMIGGKDYKESRFNRALYAFRQPGSCFKPFIYATALENGYGPLDVFEDAPTIYKWGENESWEPKNYGNTYTGDITLFTAMQNSCNVVTVKLLSKIKIKNVKRLAYNCGFQKNLCDNLTLALGT